MRKLLIISRYKESLDWLNEYPYEYIVYNKGESIDGVNIINTENIGGNQRDILEFIHNNYVSLPDIMVFLQAYPFDHCKKEIFDKLILNNCFTPIESCGAIPSNSWELRTTDGGYMEINNDWFIENNNRHHNTTCRYQLFDSFMEKYFENYYHGDWIRFSPGSQYIVEKEQALYYPREFWERLMNELNSQYSTEGHIIERALWMIFQCDLKLK